ncbi:nitronate monooxygenase family protein [Alkalihalobacillus sp. AL-G]|uniref:NAD(P)H-dependent flavin oxidoreductase n=1 Tax=Alkalihalobacillus sp. AL-G TaxID=2926399 RepID=UPI00272BF0B1|nr:nitronate monooxygenase [Alkalihalobacillus sp. AL-G]WLD94134.1 nitronate monooxygenase [Alkalihalobacillus sp. AL-G]
MNPVCQLLNIRYPILQGGMGNVSNAPLSAAISEAGGLGTIGIGTLSPVEIEQLIIDTKKRTGNPFAVNIPLSVTPFVKEAVQSMFQYEVPVVVLSAGNPAPYIPKFKENGLTVICVVASVKHAQKAEKAGADIIVAEGYEAAGINATEESTTMTLIPQVTDAVKIPVVAAGGIGDGRGLAAALSLGATGVQMGTRFIATQEGVFHESYKQKLVEANDTDTTIVGRKYGKIRRLLKTAYAEQLQKDEAAGVDQQTFIDKTTEEFHLRGAVQGNFAEGFINSGQIAGLVGDVPTVDGLIQRMVKEAEQQLKVIERLL